MSKALTASIKMFSRFMSGLYFSLSHAVVYPMATAKNSSVKRIINRSMFVTSTFGNLNNSLDNLHAAAAHTAAARMVSSELHQNSRVYPVLALAKVRSKARHNGTRQPSITAGGRDASLSTEIRHIRRTVVVFNTESYVLAGHVIEGSCTVPGFERISWIRSEVRSSGKCGCSIDGRQKHQVASRVVDRAPSKGNGKEIFVEPETVIQHGAHKALLGTGGAIAKAAYPAAALASQVEREGKCHLVEFLLGMIVILDQDAVVRMPARPMRRAYSVPAHSVIVGKDGYAPIRTPIDLHSKTRTTVGRAIRLPSIDEPAFNL